MSATLPAWIGSWVRRSNPWANSLQGQAVRDHRADVEPAAGQQIRHLNPGLEHEPAVDAEEPDPLEDHPVVEVDGEPAVGQAERRVAAALAHELEPLVEDRLPAHHVEDDVDAAALGLVEDELLHVVLRGVEDRVGAHLAADLEPHGGEADEPDPRGAGHPRHARPRRGRPGRRRR